MSESQTLKTMVHETAHSMLHDKDVNKDILAPAKDRNTKEVEAESIAYTVCQHFGIDTSDYSFGYIAGWSTGRDMGELKSSLMLVFTLVAGVTITSLLLCMWMRSKKEKLPFLSVWEKEKWIFLCRFSWKRQLSFVCLYLVPV